MKDACKSQATIHESVKKENTDGKNVLTRIDFRLEKSDGIRNKLRKNKNNSEKRATKIILIPCNERSGNGNYRNGNVMENVLCYKNSCFCLLPRHTFYFFLSLTHSLSVYFLNCFVYSFFSLRFSLLCRLLLILISFCFAFFTVANLFGVCQPLNGISCSHSRHTELRMLFRCFVHFNFRVFFVTGCCRLCRNFLAFSF